MVGMRHENMFKKHDNQKPRIDLIPPEAVFALADILTMGAEKYGDRNWESGTLENEGGRIYAAAQRHLWQWWHAHQNGQDVRDEESGRSHLHHALCNIAFLITYELRDDLNGMSNAQNKKEI